LFVYFFIITFVAGIESIARNFKVIMTQDYIRHQGIIERIDEHKVYVRIEQKAACNDCQAKSLCLASDKKEKIVEVNDNSGCYSLHEEVIVSVRSYLGLFAAFVAFILPLLFIISSLVISLYISGSEALGGLIGLAVLIPYFFILYLFRDRLRRKLLFTISKIPELTSISTVTN